MERQITLLTVSQPIAPGDGGAAQYAPFAGAGSAPFLLENPVLSTMILQDDDDQFVSGFYSGDATQQALTQPAVIGYGASQITLPIGTRLSNFIGAVLTDDAGNRFVALYPRRFDPWDLGEELGDGHTVLIIPLPALQPDDSLAYPVFDPSRPVRFTEVRGLGPAPGDAIAYAPAAATGPVDMVPCFAADTRIQTAAGPQPVQALRPGDLILTRDHGFQPLLWSGSRVLDEAHLDLMPQHRPIRIAPGALGPDQPARALTVSPQHRILLRSRIAQRMFGTPEILVPARRLTGMAGVEVLRDTSHVTYWHLLFRRHEIVLSESAWTESLLPGPQALRAFDPQARARIVTTAPDLTARPAPARPIPPGHAQRRLVQRHLTNPTRPLVEPAPEPAL
ncbi:MAG: Hint domain-containing protein [Paracoccus sp. (in: a-proteobacteria)]|uniref:Hint domain-containing protein n=1 Tax=Paracoccus sp. TaxID=267 RepID=UPI00391A99FE